MKKVRKKKIKAGSDLGKVGLLCNGGGARGICQSGSLRAFHDLGFTYDTVYGASVGSLNACLVHQDQLDLMTEIWMTVRNKDVYSWNPLDLFRTLDGRASIYD